MSEAENIQTAATDEVEQSLYAKRQKIYPREVHGIFAALRTSGVLALLGLYYIIPWLMWDGHQAILFDLPARKFYILGLVFWPQDFFYLTLLLIVATLSLFFFTALAGRLWCGYACPQTVWTEAFLWIERKVEGTRPQQMKRDKESISLKKFRVKSTKHLIWLVFSIFTGLTFVGYFSPMRELAVNFVNWNLGPWEMFWIFFYGFATYGNAGWLREQVCTYMCPYARFQSAMIDKDTLIISYDEERGEPRGARKKSVDPKNAGLGHCIDCTICVQVCPTGIDIRDGLQYQCIGCAACIDACDDVMEKMGYEKGLVRYTTLNIIEGGESRLLRPRIVIYATFLLVLASSLLIAIINRVPLELDVIRDRNELYSETYEGMIENVYTLKLVNKDQTDHQFRITVTGIENVTMTADKDIVPVATGEVVTMAVRLKADPFSLPSRSVPIDFHMQAVDDESLNTIEDAKFIGPFRK